jgi:hypothetical protein
MNRVFFACNIVLMTIVITNHKPRQFDEIQNNRLQAAINKEIQVNRLPHPFNVNGSMPFQVWVDGERLPLNSMAAKTIVDGLGLQFEQPKGTAALHSGAGWLQPLNINN